MNGYYLKILSKRKAKLSQKIFLKSKCTAVLTKKLKDCNIIIILLNMHQSALHKPKGQAKQRGSHQNSDMEKGDRLDRWTYFL